MKITLNTFHLIRRMTKGRISKKIKIMDLDPGDRKYTDMNRSGSGKLETFKNSETFREKLKFF